MVLLYCKNGNLRNYLNESKSYINYETKIVRLQRIARGLFDIHNAGKVHKDFHSGNILIDDKLPYISDLGMCQPANKQSDKVEGIYGVLPYMAPEVLRGHQYTKAADIYSFGIVMNEFLSEEIPYNDIPHDEFLAIKICKGFRPNISKDIPKLLADLIIKCWDTKVENRPTAKELYQMLTKWDNEIKNSENSEISFQIKECDKIGEKKFKNRSNKDKSKKTQTHPQATYVSRLLNFSKPLNSSDLSGNDLT
jgi:serine/threonine protein kinase